MKALVLSGGTGVRLRPFSYSTPKQLMPVANKPVLQYGLEAIGEAAITEVGIVVGGHGAQIKDFIGDGAHLGLRVSYIEQAAPKGLAHCVLLARGFLADDDFLMYLGDNLIGDGLREAAAGFAAQRPDVKLMVSKVDDPSRFGIAEFDAAGRVFGLAEKPAEPRSDFAIMGIYFFTPAIHRAVARLRPSARGELEITDAISEVMAGGGTVTAEEYPGYWRDAGTVDDLLECNRFMLSGLRGQIHGRRDRHSLIQGEVLVEPGARIIRSQMRGPVIVGADSVVADSVIGPGTVIGRDCRLTEAEAEDSVLLDGAAVCGLRGIRGSVIGRYAEVHGCRVQAGMRLRIGDDAHVELTR
jgi:glucose-1-phosphate thymidylyltransferase